MENHYRPSTLKLVDTLLEQQILEQVLDRSKPPRPIDIDGLHPLLYTPFRYRSYPFGSRFRPANDLNGVFYGSEDSETSMAEMAFYRHLFFSESPGMALPTNPVEHTAFRVHIECDRLVDLTEPPFVEHEHLWADPANYNACHQIATVARQSRVDAIRYRSVRDPKRRTNVAVLRTGAFRSKTTGIWSNPTAWQTWNVFVRSGLVQVTCEMPPSRREFSREMFRDDPRMSAA